MEAEQLNLEKSYDDGVGKGIEQRNIEIAKKMLTKNKAIEEIAELTGLTIEQIEALKHS
jgi:predicted transposase/invertase (TIGR01784 family)